MGISAMMHGYLAFDKDWNLLTPFRTWQNTMTGEEAAELTELFGFNIPQRWSRISGMPSAPARRMSVSLRTSRRWRDISTICSPA